ncbi:hypothetical protein [Pollutibacter soli]|uniref:M61 family metallopeptidase n=1 Tax=Pollutibacter soli TaxID=3034157 RepID=UPI003013201D
MKYNIVPAIAFALLLISCKSTRTTTGTASRSVPQKEVGINIDLKNVNNDQVKVTVNAPAITGATTEFKFPRIIPGTYAIADYGRYVDSFFAYDKAGRQLPVVRKDSNTFEISGAEQLAKLTYVVNDTYDSEIGDVFMDESSTIFSPAGTNILAGKNFVLNMAGFAGYFSGMENIPYKLEIAHPGDLYGATSMMDTEAAKDKDVFLQPRYAELIDHPVMYAAPDTATFTVDGMEVLLAVYSPKNKAISARAFKADMQKMMVAQKAFLGKINNTKKYAILLYITENDKTDARGQGALEHNTSTTAVFSQSMKAKSLIDVISHEFFHTLTPLKVHSREIQDFNFSEPVMSQNLWMYEGVTEYFAHLFQVNQGLITEDEFLKTMAGKIAESGYYADTVSFTRMSKNVVEPEMKKQYANVYQKGALLAMCIDIIIREKSGGKKGILDVMGELSNIYGQEKPFDDNAIFAEFTKLSYPEVGAFLQEHIIGGKPVDYEMYFAKMGATPINIKVPEPTVFIIGEMPYIMPNAKKQIIALVPDTKNEFMNSMGIKNRDVLLEMNGQSLDATEIMKVLMAGNGLDENETVTMKIERNGSPMELKANVKLNYKDQQGYKFTDESKKALKDAWMKGR